MRRCAKYLPGPTDANSSFSIVRHLRVPDHLFDGTPRRFHIYTKADADAKGIKYRHWYEADLEDMERCITSDGWVVQFISQNGRLPPSAIGAGAMLRRYSAGVVRLPWDFKNNTPKEPYGEFNLQVWVDEGCKWGEFNPDVTRQCKIVKKHVPVQAAIRLYGMILLVRGGDLTENDKNQILAMCPLHVTYFKYQYKDPWRGFMRLIEEKEGSKILMETLESTVHRIGLNFEKVIKGYQTAYEKAEAKGSPQAMIAASDRLLGILTRVQENINEATPDRFLEVGGEQMGDGDYDMMVEDEGDGAEFVPEPLSRKRDESVATPQEISGDEDIVEADDGSVDAAGED